MKSILIKGKKFTYQIKRKTSAHLRLHLTSLNSFYVSCPNFTPGFIVQRFIQKNIDWIAKNSLKLKAKRKILKVRSLKILGLKYQMFFNRSPKDLVAISHNKKQITVGLSKYSSKYAGKLLENKLRPLARQLINDNLEELAEEFNFKYNRVSIRNQSSRFGSCSSKGNLNLNWQIIFFPKSKFRHILLHELTHLKIKNHSKYFWQQLSLYDPNAKANNKWLKEQGTKYLIF
jgi:predicted metal-dependent hydrolase